MNFTLPMLGAAGTTAGLVIRSGEVEILAMKGKTVTSRVRVAIEGKDDGHLVSAIQQARAAANLKAKRLAVSMPSQDVLFRFFTVPAVPKNELDSVVQFEARKYIPFRMETLIWSYAATPVKGANQMEIVFSAMSRDLFRQLQDACIAAGVHPSLMEPRSVSLSRLIPPSKSAKEFVCLVEVEAGAAHLAIVKDHLPYLTRDIVFARVADTGPEGPGQEATPGAAAEPAPPAGPDPRAERLRSELSVSMNFFLREYPSTTIERIVLFGEETVVGPWCRWLTDQLHCIVELGNTVVDPKVDGGLPLTFAPALGLLEAARRPAAAPLDFLPRSTVKSAAPQPVQARLPKLSLGQILATIKSPQGVMAMILSACLLGGWAFLEGLSVSAERTQLTQLVQARPDVDARLNAMSGEELKSLKENAENQLKFLKQLIEQRVAVATKLDALAHALPDGLWLTHLSFEDAVTPSGRSEARMTIRGACYLDQPDQEMGAIHRFEEQVKRDQRFLSGFSVAQVDQIDAQRTPEEKTYRAFQLNCNPARAL